MTNWTEAREELATKMRALEAERDEVMQDVQNLDEQIRAIQAAINALDGGNMVLADLIATGVVKVNRVDGRRPRGTCPKCDVEIALTPDSSRTYNHRPCGPVRMDS